jgi:hypothetical protein
VATDSVKEKGLDIVRSYPSGVEGHIILGH